MQTNSTNLNQTDGGTVIKQGDVSSRFAYELCDENGDVINLAGKQAKVSIGNHGKIYFSTTVDVAEDNSVSFTIDRALPLGIHQIEVSCDGYVFPSDNISTTITVKSSQEQYEVAEPLKKTLSEDDVKRIIAENATGGQSVAYDDSELREALRALEERPIYDDTALAERVSTLESKEDHDTTYAAGNGLSLNGRTFSIDTDIIALKRNVEEYLSEYTETMTVALKGLIRRAPTSFALVKDGKTSDGRQKYAILFDNGCLMRHGYSDNKTVLGIGRNRQIYQTQTSSYPLQDMILSTAAGFLTIDKWQERANETYWNNEIDIERPINDRTIYDWSEAKLNDDHSNPLYGRQKNIIRTMYELGVWDDEDVLALGAIKQN